VGSTELQMDRSGTKQSGECTHFYGKGNENYELGTGFFVHKRIVSAAETVELVSYRMSYIILRDYWCHIIVLNVHDEVDINSILETIGETIKISTKESPDYFELKEHKPWFEEKRSELLDERKQSK
jgi:hypothetical protein